MTEGTTAPRPYKTLMDAREALNMLAESLGNQAFHADSPHGHNLTRAAVACEDAEDAIFSVLNVLYSYLDDEDAGLAIGLKGWVQQVGGPRLVGEDG